jgi:hypothetical protein
VKLDQARAKAFHNITAKGIYVAKRARPDTSLSIVFLTTRVKGPNIDNWHKLCHLVEYLPQHAWVTIDTCGRWYRCFELVC